MGLPSPLPQTDPLEHNHQCFCTWRRQFHILFHRRGRFGIRFGGKNPTKSDTVKEVIAKVKNLKWGVRRSSICHIKWGEFISILIAVKKLYPGCELMDVMLSVLTLQWQLIGRIHYMMMLEKSSFSFNHQFPFMLLCKMTWSKNICEERESPTQFLLPAMAPLFCPLLNWQYL